MRCVTWFGWSGRAGGSRSVRSAVTGSTGTRSGRGEQLIREAIALHLAGMREDGEPIPEPTSVDAAIVSIPPA